MYWHQSDQLPSTDKLLLLATLTKIIMSNWIVLIKNSIKHNIL